jgi:hypothetical protein
MISWTRPDKGLRPATGLKSLLLREPVVLSVSDISEKSKALKDVLSMVYGRQMKDLCVRLRSLRWQIDLYKSEQIVKSVCVYSKHFAPPSLLLFD